MEKKSRKGLVIGLLTPLFVLLLAAGFFFGINRFSIRMELCGPESQTIECGVDTYTEQGARAYFCGSLVFKKGFELEVQTQGAVEESRLGEQTVTYTADFLLWHGEARRTVLLQDTIPPELKLQYKGRHMKSTMMSTLFLC